MHSVTAQFIAFVLSFLYPVWKDETKRYFRFALYSSEVITPANFIRLYLSDWNLVYAGEIKQEQDLYLVPDCDGLEIIISPRNCEIILQVDKMQISYRDRKRIHAWTLSVEMKEHYAKRHSDLRDKTLPDNRYGRFGQRIYPCKIRRKNLA